MNPYVDLQRRTSQAPAAPLVTYVDPMTGQRMELSAASLDNAVAKTAGLLRDDLDVTPGDRIAVHLPWHWQRAVWFGACAATEAVFVPDGEPGTCTVCVLDRAHLDLAGQARDDVLVSLAPFGLPDHEPIPTGVIDAATAMRAHPDRFTPFAAPGAESPLLVLAGATLTAGEVTAAARDLADRRGLAAGSRIAVLPDDPDRDLLLLAVPLAIDGSIVMIAQDSAAMTALLAGEGAALTKG